MTRVLIADDDVVVRDVVRRYLERDGLDVSIAHDGTEALRLLGSERIDVAVLDVMMPGPDGLTLCRSLRQRGGYAVPVILLTALGEEDDRIAGLEAGADDYLTKPFSPAELVLRVAAILRRSGNVPAANADSVVIGPLRIDRAAMSVLVEDRPVELTPTEFKLLLTLAERRGRVQGRGHLLETVWEAASDIQTRTVDMHVQRLRTKLGSAGDLIETVRGFGYRLRAPQARGA